MARAARGGRRDGCTRQYDPGTGDEGGNGEDYKRSAYASGSSLGAGAAHGGVYEPGGSHSSAEGSTYERLGGSRDAYGAASQPTCLSSAARAAGLPAPSPVPVSLTALLSYVRHGQGQVAPIPASNVPTCIRTDGGVSFTQPAHAAIIDITTNVGGGAGGNSYAPTHTSSSPASYADQLVAASHLQSPLSTSGPSTTSNHSSASSTSYPSTSSKPSHTCAASQCLRPPYNSYEWGSGESTERDGGIELDANPYLHSSPSFRGSLAIVNDLDT
ncbi:hypothetical protein K438DRAFT_2032873 [Mycena galopus ATCC 62051]|nr:hypothetical protein K438DRAFT_2032873 [Mycena galopus ATCC 62051]